MADVPRPPIPPKPADPTPAASPAPTWSGTGLCPEAQGDGVPCQGTDGECERCGRALPPSPAAPR